MKKFLMISGLLLIFAYLTLCVVMYFSDITFDSFSYVEISCTTFILGLFIFLFSVFYDHKDNEAVGCIIMGLMLVGFLFVFMTLQPCVTIYHVSGHYNMKISYGYGPFCVDGQHISPGSNRYLVVNASDDTIILRKRVYATKLRDHRGGTVYGSAMYADQEQYGDLNTDSKLKVIPPNTYIGYKHVIDTVFGRPPYNYESAIDNDDNNSFAIYYLDSIPKENFWRLYGSN